MPTADSDLDHVKPRAEGGPTIEENLAPLCRHDHRLKHEGGWSPKLSDEGDWIWTSPLGGIYVVSGAPP